MQRLLELVSTEPKHLAAAQPFWALAQGIQETLLTWLFLPPAPRDPGASGLIKVGVITPGS